MMNVQILCIGKLKEAYWREACAEYAKRLRAFCNFTITELPESRLPDNPSQALIDKALEEEGEKLLAAAKGSALIPLCIEGKELDSPSLARKDGGAGLPGNLFCELRHWQLLWFVPESKESRGAAPLHVPHDLSPSAGPGHALRTDLSSLSDSEPREISQIAHKLLAGEGGRKDGSNPVDGGSAAGRFGSSIFSGKGRFSFGGI